jgi:hypothetical protein
MTYAELTEKAKRGMRRSRVDDPALPVRLRLAEMRHEAGLTSWAAFAKRHGVSAQLLLYVLSGVQEPGPAVLRITGFEKVVTYRRKK